MAVTISGVEPGSPAFRAGIGAGDRLEAIDGHPINDVLDYRFYMTARCLTLHLGGEGEQPRIKTIRKGEYEDLGLEFETYLMDSQRLCRNKCIFCFIDQMPPGMRDSLYFKDDDSRMSFLFGNYITLTNLEDRDVERIIAMRISPVNISVHTTNPALRVKMMANPHAGEVLEYLPRLAAAGIRINAQLVLCPGVNDGSELRRSLEDLTALAPGLQSVAVVPVGLTRFREGLAKLRVFTPTEAAGVIGEVDRVGNRMLTLHGQRVCYAADEFYLAAERPVPAAEFYEEFAQLENGVGLLALLEDEFRQALELEAPRRVSRRVGIATGYAPQNLIRSLARQAMELFPGLEVSVFPIRNDFFGPDITVAGLVTGEDLTGQLKGRDPGDELLFPSVMLRHEGDLFLDGLSMAELAEALGLPVRPVNNDGFQLLEAMLGEGGQTPRG